MLRCYACLFSCDASVPGREQRMPFASARFGFKRSCLQLVVVLAWDGDNSSSELPIRIQKNANKNGRQRAQEIERDSAKNSFSDNEDLVSFILYRIQKTDIYRGLCRLATTFARRYPSAINTRENRILSHSFVFEQSK
jgi:hypothetical protein